MSLKVLGTVALVALMGLTAQAEKRKSLVDEYSGQGYGMGGCGPGSVIFGDKPGIAQAGAALTNDIYSAQTFAMSSGTSNCGEQSKQASSAQFIEVNKMALEKEIARGEGENLLALSQVMGCKNETFSSEVVQQYRKSYPRGQASSSDMKQIASASCQL